MANIDIIGYIATEWDEAGNSQIGYNYLLGNIDRQGKFNSILNWVSKERLVYEI